MACNKHDQAQPKVQYQVRDDDFFAEIWGTFDTLEEAEKAVMESITATGDRRFTVYETKPLKRFTTQSIVVSEVIEL